jgi:hypothetical protein
MAHKADKKSNYYLRKTKVKIIHPFLPNKTSTKLHNDSVLMMIQTPILSPSSSSTSFQYAPRSNDNSSVIYATAIIIFYATWIFKKATYVKKSFCFQIELIYYFYCYKKKRMLIRIPFRLISYLFFV